MTYITLTGWPSGNPVVLRSDAIKSMREISASVSDVAGELTAYGRRTRIDIDGDDTVLVLESIDEINEAIAPNPLPLLQPVSQPFKPRPTAPLRAHLYKVTVDNDTFYVRATSLCHAIQRMREDLARENGDSADNPEYEPSEVVFVCHYVNIIL